MIPSPWRSPVLPWRTHTVSPCNDHSVRFSCFILRRIREPSYTAQTSRPSFLLSVVLRVLIQVSGHPNSPLTATAEHRSVESRKHLPTVGHLGSFQLETRTHKADTTRVCTDTGWTCLHGSGLNAQEWEAPLHGPTSHVTGSMGGTRFSTPVPALGTVSFVYFSHLLL